MNTTENFSQLHTDFKKVSAVPSWLGVQRDTHLQDFLRLGLPSRRDENWRFTNVTPLAGKKFSLPKVQALSIQEKKYIDQISNRLVFVNGAFARELSPIPDFKNITICSVRELIAHDEVALKDLVKERQCLDSFAHLNISFLDQGLIITVPENTAVSEVLHIISLTTSQANTLVSPFVWMRLKEQAELSVVESALALGENTVFTNALSEIVLERGATLNHTYVQDQSQLAYHVNTIDVTQAENSRFNSFSLAVGGHVARTNINCRHAGPGAYTELNGLYAIKGNGHSDHHTVIDHACPQGTSVQLYKGILSDKAHGVFNGKIAIGVDAQRVSSQQLNKNLLLSPEAVIDTKPELVIANDDVTCTHGATIGQLTAEELFYLQSRGITEIDARHMLVTGFAQEVVDKNPTKAVRALIAEILRERYFS